MFAGETSCWKRLDRRDPPTNDAMASVFHASKKTKPCPYSANPTPSAASTSNAKPSHGQCSASNGTWTTVFDAVAYTGFTFLLLLRLAPCRSITTDLDSPKITKGCVDSSDCL